MSDSDPKSTSWLTIGRGSVSYSEADAQAVLTKFAFDKTKLIWKSKLPASADPTLARRPRSEVRSKWAYQTYDCLRSAPETFSMVDVLAVAALDARAGGTEFLAIEAILPDLNEVLAHVDESQTFWELPRDELGPKPPEQGAQSWWLWRAWALLMGLDGVGVAITYKTLHRKRPKFFPIFDNNTVAQMGGEDAWQTLHHELTRQDSQFTQLEKWFDTQAEEHGGVRLTRLRIHDILLWSGALSRPGLSK